jgi:hypothetical protein
LLNRLTQQHGSDPSTRIVEEMGIWSGSARIDVAVINGELTGFELKSERDTLARLPLQVEIYNLVFDRLSLVTTERHAEKAKAVIPEWWGISLVGSHPENQCISELRRAERNPARDPLILAQMLWREEAIQLLEQYGLAAGFRSKSAPAIHSRLAEKLSLADLGSGVRAALKARRGWLGQV